MKLLDTLFYYFYCGVPRYKLGAFYMSLKSRVPNSVNLFVISIAVCVLDTLILIAKEYNHRLSLLPGWLQLVIMAFLVLIPTVLLVYFYRNNRWEKIIENRISDKGPITIADRLLGLAMFMIPYVLLFALTYPRMTVKH